MAREPSSSAEGARLIDGRAIAEKVTDRVAAETRRLSGEVGLVPGLAVVIVGNDPASQTYVSGKGKKAKEVGFHSVQHSLPEDVSEATLLGLVTRLNDDPSIHGILVQLPLPRHIDKERVIEAIRPDKDVDGFHPVNAGRLASGLGATLVPCTPAGCLIFIKSVLGSDLGGRSAVVIGRSTIVGRPMANLLINDSCTVTVAHSRTGDLPAVVRGAEIVVAAVGRAEMVRGDWIRRGATVIDVGMNRIPAPEKGEGKTRLVGDVAFEECRKVAGAITPVPGGVGPMTIAMLMANTLAAACLSRGLPAPPIMDGIIPK
jgi:methylenetetrahydrofolate dehydrogenase (NADP+)/methenyltetrahydrofolate cyclohydrolase